MTEPSNFESTVVEWKHRHGVRDDDPILAALELLKVFFQNVKIEIPPDSDSAKLLEVRTAIQQLNRLGIDFSKQTRDLTLEMRTLPDLNKQLRSGRTTAFVVTAIPRSPTDMLLSEELFQLCLSCGLVVYRAQEAKHRCKKWNMGSSVGIGSTKQLKAIRKSCD